MLEDALRETFAQQSRSAPPVHDPATVAIREARRRRRQRVAAAGLASVVAMAGMFAGTMSLRDLWQPPPASDSVVVGPALSADQHLEAPADPAPGPPVNFDIRVINVVWTVEGDRFMLTGSAIVERAFRTPYGLLYGSDREIRLRSGDQVSDIASDVGDWVASEDGEWVGFVVDGQAEVLSTTGAQAPATAAVGDEVTAVGFWGGRLVLQGPGGFDVWDPAQPYEPAWNGDVVAVYGAIGDDLAVLVEQAGESCVAVVPAGEPALRPDQSSYTCGVPVGGDGHGWLSPGGQWLAIPVNDQLVMHPVFAAATPPTRAARCPHQPGIAPVWQDATVVLTADSGGAVRCDVHGQAEPLALPDRVTTPWRYVPSLPGSH